MPSKTPPSSPLEVKFETKIKCGYQDKANLDRGHILIYPFAID